MASVSFTPTQSSTNDAPIPPESSRICFAASGPLIMTSSAPYSRASVFATLHYYRCSLGGGMSDTEGTRQARRADRFWLLGYTTMFLAPSLVLFLVRLRLVASFWLALWFLYVFFLVRYFPTLQTPRVSQDEQVK